MPNITITCPNCRFSREQDASAIPANVSVAICPQCRQRFDLRAAIAAAAASEPAAPVPEPVSPELPESAMPTWEQLMPEPPLPPENGTGEGGGEPPPSPSRPASPRRLRFAFSGTARDYFGIWIVNTLLKIVTLGIYSAWAKVRKRRYFYGSTRLNNTDFEYLADPFALFKGWLIAAAIFILYTIGSKVSPILSGTVGLVFFLGLPWLIVRSRVFNMRNSAHRNIRFAFNPDYREAYVVFAGLPCLLPFTLGLIAPYMVYRQKKFFVENSGYGRTRCTFDVAVKNFYLVFLKAAGWLILLAAGLGLSAYFISATARELSPLFLDGGAAGGKIGKKGAIAATILVIAFFNFLYLFFAVYVQTALANLTWNGTRLKHSRFVSTLRVRDMAWLYLSSGAAILCSCGLLIPWATVRITRYRLGCLGLDLKDDPEGFLGWGYAEVGSAGEEIGDMFGIDIGI
jgi:uncharacterized membrane protein YjgN (DUF898 family)